MGEEQPKVQVSIVVQFIAYLIALLMAYGAMDARVSVVETKVGLMQSDLAEIKADLKILLRRPLP